MFTLSDHRCSHPHRLARNLAILILPAGVQQPLIQLLEVARTAPALPPYDAQLRSLGGDPDAALGAA